MARSKSKIRIALPEESVFLQPNGYGSGRGWNLGEQFSSGEVKGQTDRQKGS